MSQRTCEKTRCSNQIPEKSRSDRRYCSASCRATESGNRRRASLDLYRQAATARAEGRHSEADALDSQAAKLLASGVFISRRGQD